MQTENREHAVITARLEPRQLSLQGPPFSDKFIQTLYRTENIAVYSEDKKAGKVGLLLLEDGTAKRGLESCVKLFEILKPVLEKAGYKLEYQTN